MCGRYAASTHKDQLIEIFEVDEVVDAAAKPWLTARFNIAPTDAVSAIVERLDKDSGDVTRKLTSLRWGLVPSWSKSLSARAPMINARLETVAEKPSFARPLSVRRCLIPGDGYYEWYSSETARTAAGKPVKQPFYIHPTDSEPMVMAGLYEFWKNPDATEGEDPWVSSCTIITTQATDDLGRIHERMPVQIRAENFADWLNPKLTDVDEALSLTHVPESGEMTAYAVSTLVNKVSNDGPELIEPLETTEQAVIDEAQETLL